MSDCELEAVAQTSIVIADDHPLIRIGIRHSFSGSERFRIVGEAPNGDETLRLCEDLKPDMLLLDVDMPGPGVATLVERIRVLTPATKVVILTASLDADVIALVHSLDLDGLVHKDDGLDELKQALRVIAVGENWTSHLFRRPAQEAQNAQAVHFTPRERQILAMIAQGEDNSAIAFDLKLRPQTVRNYVAAIYEKISVRGRVEAAHWAKENGWHK